MVTSGETQLSEIVERLIRLEVEVAGNNKRLDDTNVRIGETNARITETTNLLLEAIRENSRQIAETNRRIAESNRRIDESNRRIDTQGENLRQEFRTQGRISARSLGRISRISAKS